MATPRTFSFPLMPLFLLVGIFYLNFVSRVALAPLLPVMEKDLGLGHGEAGSLFFFIAFGYGIGLLGSGFVSSRLNHRVTITISGIMGGLTLILISQLNSVSGMRIGLVLIGVFAGFYLPSGIATLTELISQEHWGKAMAIHELGPNLGFITAPLLSEFLLNFFTWRFTLAILGASAVLMGFLFFGLGRGSKNRGDPPRLQSFRKVMSNLSCWVMASFFTIAIGSSIGIYTMMPLFLVSEMGMDRGWANTLIGLSRSFGIVVLFFSGLIIDRVGSKQTMVLFLSATGTFTLLLGAIQGAVITPVLIFFQAAATACLFPVGFTILSVIFPSRFRTAAVSVVIFIGFLFGGGTVPTGIGYWAEAFSFSSAFSLLGLIFLAMLPLFLRLRIHLHPPA